MVSEVLGDNSPRRKQPSSKVSRWLMILLMWLKELLCSLTGINSLMASKCFFSISATTSLKLSSFEAAFCEARTNKSVTLVKAETTTTSLSCFALSRTISKTSLIFCALGTEVPPNFYTFILLFLFKNANVFYTPMNSLHLEKSMETGLYVKMYTPKG